MILVTLTSILSLLATQQDDDACISNLIEQLSSSRIEERDSAGKELQGKGARILERLERSVGLTADPEVKARIEGLIRKIRITEADSLAERGALDEALHKLAEADGAKHAASYISERLDSVGSDLRSWYPPADQIVEIIPDYDRQAKRVLTVHGLWGLAFLLQELGLERFEVIPTGHLLEAMGKPAVLPLIRALSSKNHLLQTNACFILNEIMEHLKRSGLTPEWLDQHDPEWIQATTRLSQDEGVRKSVREMAQSMSEQLAQARRSRLIRHLVATVPQERLAAEQQVRAEGAKIISQLRLFVTAQPDGEERTRLEHLLKDLTDAKKSEAAPPSTPNNPRK